MKSFLKLAAESRVRNNNLLKVDSIIDWDQLRLVLKKIDRSGLGPTGYDTLKLLKALILQAWYSLSDPELEESLRVRMDFLLFTDLDENVPDSTTICRFRNLLISRGLLEKALKNINRQLEEKNLKVKPTEGAIVDATIIESAAAPQKTIDAIPIDREEEGTVYEASDVQLSADKDARWLKKGNRSYFGYKSFVTVGARQGYVEKVAVTPANVSECKYFEKAIEGVETSRYYADKGYASAENRAILKKKGVKSAIMHAARKNNPLGHWQKVFNKLVSRVRYRVEQAFGTMKRKFNFTRASYFGTEKVLGQCLLKAIAFNLLKAINIA
ncbi:MAG: IS5 family transposase [Holosporales bacterium]|jgi:IS5 family transposase|nr:IS5 family transposase [Holosporales bacterium]